MHSMVIITGSFYSCFCDKFAPWLRVKIEIFFIENVRLDFISLHFWGEIIFNSF